MRAGKAYISSLGTTGLLVTSSLLLLAVVGALVAFDRWPAQAATEADVVAIAADDASRAGNQGRVRAAGASASGREAGAAAAATAAPLRRAAVRAGRLQVESFTDSVSNAAPAADPVVSSLPAPEAAPGGAGAPSPPASAAERSEPAPLDPVPALPTVGDIVDALPGDQPADDEGVVGPTAGELGEAAQPLSPRVGHSVRDTGDAVHSALTDVTETATGR